MGPMAESQTVEYKESWRDEYLKWICGFANTQGGTLYIGKRDDGSPCGVQDAKKLMEDIPNKVRDMLGLVVDVDLLAEEGKDVVRIMVDENPYPVNYKGEYYQRAGYTNQRLMGSALTHFLLKKTGKKWDSVPVENVDIEDLDKESFDIFFREALRNVRMSSDDLKLSRRDLLEKLNLMDGPYLKRAVLLLFHRNPEKWITGAWVKIGYFENDADIRYQDEIHGSLMIQADRVIDLLYTKYLIAEISYENVTRIEHYPFPKDAVREAIFNALIHQDFAASIPVQISVYKDRLYISNDCIFPENWTAETLLQKHRSLPHNPDIASTFYRAGFIESWGRGIEKICRICKNYGIPDPEYTVHGGDIMMMFKANVRNDDPNSGQNDPNNDPNVTSLDLIGPNNGPNPHATDVADNEHDVNSFFDNVRLNDRPNGPNSGPNLIERELDILRIVANNDRITLDNLAAELKIGRTTLKRSISTLQQKGLLTREGGTRGRWVVTLDTKSL